MFDEPWLNTNNNVIRASELVLEAWNYQGQPLEQVKRDEFGWWTGRTFTGSYDPKAKRLRGKLHESDETDPDTTHGQQDHEHVDELIEWDIDLDPHDRARAELIPPAGYDGWYPEAGATEKDPGSKLTFDVRLTDPEKPGELSKLKARWRFELLDVSHEPGTCLNAPIDGPKRTADLGFEADREQAARRPGGSWRSPRRAACPRPSPR